MDDKKKTKAQLLDELAALHRQIRKQEKLRKSLKESEERYRTILENIEEGYYEVDLTGKYTFVNLATGKFHGCSPDELIGKSYSDYTTPETAKRLFTIFNEIYRTGFPVEIFDHEVIRKNGEIGILEVSASLIRDQTGNPTGFRGITRDITERKKMEAEQARYRDFIENATDGCYELNLRGTIIFANQAVCRMIGYSLEEFKGMDYRSYTSPETAKKIFAIYNEVYRTGRPAEKFEYEIIHKDQEIHYLETSASLIRDLKGKPIGFRGITRDITERKKLEMEKERYREFVENIEDGCWETDLAGIITFCNEAASRTMGYTREEFLSLKSRPFSTPEGGKEALESFTKVYQTGNPITLFDHEIRRKDGETIYLEMSVSLIKDQAGKPIGFRGVSRDVTERKKREAETIRLTKQLNQARKMEAVGTLAGGIAHDFNNLLMGIQGYTSLMLLDTDPSHPFYEKLKAIEGQIVLAADLTSQLLGYARGGRYEVKTSHLNELIGNTASIFGKTKSEIAIHKTFDKALWTVEVDQVQIEQVLLNIFMNAWQAMDGGGSIYLQTENVMLDESYVQPYETKPGPFVKITITDTGVGMDVNTKERIFEPFFTTKEMGRGAGLGLASAYGIIRGHGGMVNVYSEKGLGTTFNIYIPASKEEVIPEKLPAREIMNMGKTVLLVDDEKIISDVAGTMITRLGYQLLTAQSGQEAVEIYQENPDRIDVVILDMVMPGMGGGKAFDLIQSVNPKAKVILSSGFSLNVEAKEIMNRGARAFLQKPFVIDDLSRVIREVLESP